MGRLKLDEDLSRSIIEHLAARKFEVLTVREQGWGGFKDPELWPRLQRENVLFVTADKGFGDIRQYPPGDHGGILLLRPAQESISGFRALLDMVFQKYDPEELIGCLTVATPYRIRVRRNPVTE